MLRPLQRVFIAAVLVVAAAAAVALPRAQQLQYLSGQGVAPFFEGWEQNADGSFNMVFGYMNRNYREELNIPMALLTQGRLDGLWNDAFRGLVRSVM